MFAKKSLAKNYQRWFMGFLIKIYKSCRCFDKEETSFILDGGNIKKEKLKMSHEIAVSKAFYLS